MQVIPVGGKGVGDDSNIMVGIRVAMLGGDPGLPQATSAKHSNASNTIVLRVSIHLSLHPK